MAEAQSGTKELVISRVFSAPIHKVWQAWTEPGSFVKWWGPKYFTCPHCSINLKVGGKYLNCMRAPDGTDYWSTGVYKEIIPHKKLVYTDSFSDEKGNVIPASRLNMPGHWPMELLVILTFEEDNGKTKMVLHHKGLPLEIFDDCIAGWQESFDKLEQKIK